MATTKTGAVLLVVGLVVGVVAGYGVGFMVYQSQISQLQSDLSETQSTLSETQSALSVSQSEAESLQGQLTEAQTTITSLQTQLSEAQTTVTSLETQLSEAESDYSALSSEYEQFKSDVTSLADSLGKKLNLEIQIIEIWVHYERGEILEFTAGVLALGPYVDAVGDAELSTIWDELMVYWDAEDYAGVDIKFADLMERNSASIQSDLSELDILLGS